MATLVRISQTAVRKHLQVRWDFPDNFLERVLIEANSFYNLQACDQPNVIKMWDFFVLLKETKSKKKDFCWKHCR